MATIEQMTFETIERLGRAKRIEDIQYILRQIAAGYGYSAFLITGVPLPGETLAQHVLLNGWPAEWMEHYNKNDYVHFEPVANQIRSSVRPFRWSDVPYDRHDNPAGHRVMREAGEFGMQDGYTVPIYGYDGYQACVTMGGIPHAVSERELSALHMVSVFGYSAAQSLVTVEALRGRRRTRPRLSEREAEVLKWTAAGKTAWEIGAILRISERTVESHLKSASRKLNAVNKTQAVALALRAGLVI